eukprot:gene2443-8767_t
MRLSLLLTCLLAAQPLANGFSRSQTSAIPSASLSKDGCNDLMRSRAQFGGVIYEGDNSDGSPIFTFARGDSMDAVAHAVFVDSKFTDSNFGKLRIVTEAGYPDSVQVAAAGYVEGWMTAERIFDHFTNTKHYFETQLYPGHNMTKANEWLRAQREWTEAQITENEESHPIWRVVDLVITQFEGLVSGYLARVLHEKEKYATEGGGAASNRVKHHKVGDLTREDLVFLNNNGELYDVIDSIIEMERQDAEDKSNSHNSSSMGGARKHLNDLDASEDPRIAFRDLALRGKCTSLIKVAGDLSDLYIGHSTWDSYTSALRIYKMYEFTGLSDSAIVSRKLSFSSYPGEVFSDDDFYITELGLVQYMVVDLKKFKPKIAMEAGMMWIVEQVPKKVYAADMTAELARGYWPSYNVPYFELVEKYSTKEYKEFGLPVQWLKYQISPRANIFRRDQGKVEHLRDIRDLMRLNAYQTDKYSFGNSLAAICGRGDLLDADIALPRGCYDSKVTSYKLALHLEAEVVNGPPPTQINSPFKWDEKKWPASKYSRRGHPDEFNF